MPSSDENSYESDKESEDDNDHMDNNKGPDSDELESVDVIDSEMETLGSEDEVIVEDNDFDAAKVQFSFHS